MWQKTGFFSSFVCVCVCVDSVATRWLLHRLLRRLMRFMSLARLNSATFTSQGNLLTMMFLRAKSQCTICRDKWRFRISTQVNAWNPSRSPFWIWGVAWPEQCGRRRWWRGSADQDPCSGGTCGSAGRSSVCRSSRTPWSRCKVLRTQTMVDSHVHRTATRTDVLISHPRWCSSPATGGCSYGAPASSWWKPLSPHVCDGHLKGKTKPV